MRNAETIRLPNMTPLVAVIGGMLFLFLGYGVLNPGCRDRITVPISSQVLPHDQYLQGCIVVNVASFPENECIGTMRGRSYDNPASLCESLRNEKTEYLDLRVFIRADRETPFERVSAVMQVCRDSGNENFSLVATAW